MNARTFAIAMCFASLIGCSSVDVTTEYDRDMNFAGFKTYDWMERHNPRDGGPTALNNPIIRKNIQSAIERELQAKGMQQSDESPDVFIAIHTGVKDKVDVERHAYRYGRWGRRVGSYTTVEQYKEGSIVVVLVDGKTREMIWRGVAKDALSKGESRSDYVDEMIKELFKEYPPAK